VLARAAAVLLGAVACVEITTAEGGVQSIALNRLPPSIVAGDILRDSIGRPLNLRATAYGETGDSLSGPTFTYGFLPLGSDTGAARSALTVDAATGAVRAATLPGVARVRVTARYGERLQIVDTLSIVRRPTRIRRAVAGDASLRLQFFCNDAGTQLVTATSDSVIANATRALAVRLIGDSTSATDTVPVPDYLVQYRVVPAAGQRPIPIGLSPFGNERPAVYMTRPTLDRPIGHDTTGSTGVTVAQLRVLPSLLREPTYAVSVIARVRVGTEFLPDSVVFAVALTRRNPPSGAACP
jgi:hypothetical protein